MSSDYGLVERLFSNLTYLRYLAFYEREENESQLSLGVAKQECNKKRIYQVFDGKIRTKYAIRLYVPLKEFETFESLLEFTQEFTGFPCN